jgi:DNA-binding SARP family transcriptional activator
MQECMQESVNFGGMATDYRGDDSKRRGAKDGTREALVIRFFGGFEARRGDLPLPRLRTRKDAWLLALLALRNRQPSDRTWLAGTLWPESTEAQSLAYLRSSLTLLRQALGKDAIRLTSPSSRTVALDLTGADVDIVEFDRLIAQGDGASLRKAVEIYCGPLLEDCEQE